MNPSVGIFNLSSAKDLFYCIRHTFGQYQRSKAKEIDKLLFVVMGLTHLREWIAPGYDKPETPPKDDAERFSQSVYRHPSFRMIRAVCNRSKHMKPKCLTGPATDTRYGLIWDDIPDVDAVLSADLGAPSAYFVDGRDIEEIIQEVILEYESGWFRSQTCTGG